MPETKCILLRASIACKHLSYCCCSLSPQGPLNAASAPTLVPSPPKHHLSNIAHIQYLQYFQSFTLSSNGSNLSNIAHMPHITFARTLQLYSIQSLPASPSAWCLISDVYPLHQNPQTLKTLTCPNLPWTRMCWLLNAGGVCGFHYVRNWCGHVSHSWRRRPQPLWPNELKIK